MNDTPRTDAYVKDPSLPMVPAGLARQLERELKMANNYIKQLEEAGDDLYVGWRSERNNKDKYLENWKQAKEAKP